MKVKPMLTWLYKSSLLAFGTFYLIMFAVLLVTWLISRFFPAEHVAMNSFSVSPQVMLFIYGILQFYGATRFGLGHGVSRKSIFLSYLLFALSAAVVVLPLNLFGEWLGALSGLDTRPISRYFFLSTCDVETLRFSLELLVERACSLLFFSMLGYFVGGVYYRLGTLWKWILSIAVPILFLVIVPLIVTYLFTSEMRAWLRNFIEDFVMLFLLKTPLNLALFFFVPTVLLAGLCFLLIRKAPLKTAK